MTDEPQWRRQNLDEPHRFGWRRQNPDWRDRTYAVPIGMALPSHFDLYGKMPPIWSQGNLGACTAHGTLRAWCIDRQRQGFPQMMPSRLLQYYDSRALEGTVLIDAGASCRDAIKATAQWGACDEALWPYNTALYARKPPDAAYADAARHKTIAYQAIPQNLYAIKAAILAGNGVVFGFQVYQNFEAGPTPRTGLMYMPEGADIGGHCVCAIGWNSNNYILCANSWGTRWGDPDHPGCFWMPPEYITYPQLASDFWVIQAVQS